MFIKPLWVTQMLTKVTRGTQRTNHLGTVGRANTRPEKISAQPRVKRLAGR